MGQALGMGTTMVLRTMAMTEALVVTMMTTNTTFPKNTHYRACSQNKINIALYMYVTLDYSLITFSLSTAYRVRIRCFVGLYISTSNRTWNHTIAPFGKSGNCLTVSSSGQYQLVSQRTVVSPREKMLEAKESGCLKTVGSAEVIPLPLLLLLLLTFSSTKKVS